MKANLLQSNAIIFFTRIPVPGKTKTRLSPLLTMDECCLLQKAFIRDVYQVLKEVKTNCDILVCFSQEGGLADLSQLLPGVHSFFPQQGENIGEKMHNAISQTLNKGYSRCLLIGSDLPLLRAAALDEAFSLLETNDVVLCPTEDGGYYLIGMKEPCADVFQIEYGISTVFEKTLVAAVKAGKSCVAGQGTMDIDTPDDLFNLREKLALENEFVCLHTRNILRDLSCLHG